MTQIWQQAKFPILSFLTAMALALIGVAIDSLYNALLLTAFFWSTALLPFAVALYRMRGVNRLIYGLFEFAVGFAALFVGILKATHTPHQMSSELIATNMLLMFGGIYFIVRALDNVGEGLMSGWKAAARWQALFPKL